MTKLMVAFFLLGTATVAFGETFDCLDPRERGSAQVLVVATVNDDRETGKIEVANVQYETLYGVAGFDRYWAWGDLEGEPEFVFRIQPDGTGHYFELPNDLIPKQEFRCRER